ncbi:hypothetical protein M8J76_010637 [Diaphorina citri]|nr:hypothetical protein M8J76_010637 [Diaphorina citri]
MVDEQVERDIEEKVVKEIGEQLLARLERKRAEMESFYTEVVNKREARNKALTDIARKMRRLEKMEEELEKEREEKQTLELHCRALKEVNKITKEMLRIRETQVSDLKTRLKDVEKKLLESPEEIKIEYEKQMTNYKKLRELYEQRAAAAELEHKTMIEKELAKNALLEAKLKEIQEEIQAQLEKYKENKKQILEMEKNIQLKDDEINNLNENLTSSLAENHILNSQMTLVNNLFSNMLINPMINLDMLIKLIQDNYLLIIDLINNHEINDTVSLLVDLEKKIDQETLAIQNDKQLKQLENYETPMSSAMVEAVESNQTSTSKDSANIQLDHAETNTNEESPADQDETNSTTTLDKSHIQKEIANNLPKVWRILIELLNTHQEQYENNDVNENFESCYKNIKTNTGKTHQVISVSQTFIRLKHLILEKNHLTNQLAKLKTLNNHLEIRLNHSEQRLNTVTTELKKTWNVVNKLKLQHKQLYTHEKILKYELKHKRNIINDLKIDLEYVREKWDLVKEKNEQNELDYKVLRKEFALRRLQYDGGRSTSESGISTDTEDDNVEIVETNDESEDDKSEVVETQSEHDVPHTNSVMSIEEDDQDEVEELESETNVSAVNNEQEVERTEVTDNTSAVIPSRETIENEAVPVSVYPQEDIVDTITTSRTDHIESHQEINSSRETKEIPGTSDANVNYSQQFLNNKITIKTIGGKIKVVAEHISTEGKPEDKANLNEPSPCETSHEKDIVKGNVVDYEVTKQTRTESPSEEQKSKQLIRQDRITEETAESRPFESAECSRTSQPEVKNHISNTDTIETAYSELSEPIEELHTERLSTETLQREPITSVPTATSNTTLPSEPSVSRTRTPEEILEARNARLKRLEDQCKNLFHKMSLTSQRSDTLSERLEELHDYYGTSNERHSPRRHREGSQDSDDTRLRSPENEPLSGVSANVSDSQESDDTRRRSAETNESHSGGSGNVSDLQDRIDTRLTSSPEINECTSAVSAVSEESSGLRSVDAIRPVLNHDEMTRRNVEAESRADAVVQGDVRSTERHLRPDSSGI